MRQYGITTYFRGRGTASERGTAAVELAIILPDLILLVFGIIQFGVAFNRTLGLNAAVREGGRSASVGGSYTDIQTAIFNAQSLFATSDIIVTTNPPTSATSGAGGTPGAPCQVAGVGSTISVTALIPKTAAGASNYALSIPFFGTFNVAYSATATYRCEQT